MQCPECKSTHVNKNGHKKGKQNYICVNCGRQFIDSYENQRGYSEEIKKECLKMYVNGMGFRGIERVKNVHHTTIINWVKQVGKLLPNYYAPETIPDVGELDDPHSAPTTDSIFLKSPERIESLAMIMGLCLLVYTLAQREIRAALKSLNYTVKNQLGKAINNPTMRWIFQCFQSVHLVTFQEKREFYNLTSEMKYILLFVPEACRNYYRYIS